MTFLSLPAHDRARAICPDFLPDVPAQSTLPHASLQLGHGTLNGCAVGILAQDASVEGGSFGHAESDAAAIWITAMLAQMTPRPLLLALDSGGARVSQGLVALGGFRRMFRAVADAQLAGFPMLAVCGRTVFGGASMLACVADERAFFERSLFGMSGPRVVEAVAGAADFNAQDKSFVAGVMGGAARAQRETTALLSDTALSVREACTRWASAQNCAVGIHGAEIALARLQGRLITQRQGLHADGLARPTNSKKIPTAQLPLPQLVEAWAEEGVLIGRSDDGGFVYGFVDGVWADSWHAWRLTNAMLCQAETAPTAPVHIVLDCPAHATSRALEAGMIAGYFSLLGLAIRHLHHCGGNVTLHITGDAAGGVHVALAGGATRVVAHAGANVRILPKVASEQIRADVAEILPTAQLFVETGVIDSVANVT